jgi:hypothetical protein
MLGRELRDIIAGLKANPAYQITERLIAAHPK